MTIVATVDNRNIEWRKNNVGSKMLEKMGWKEGEGIGKRGNANANALRAIKRQDGLGLGAKMASEGGNSESTNHFSSVLAKLQVHHGSETSSSTSKKDGKKSKKDKKSSKKVSKKRSSSSLSLPQNKVVAGHAEKRRKAKFGSKSQEDLACIFGNTEVAFESVPAVGAQHVVSEPNSESDESSKKRRSSDKEDRREKKRRKKEKKEKRAGKKEKSS